MRAHTWAAAALLLAVSAAPTFAVDVGEKAPPFVNLDQQRQRVFSRDFLGKGWVILDFFATDCVGCKQEMPVLEQVFTEFSPRGLAVLVFATDPQGEELVLPFFRERPTPLRVLLDNYQVAVKRYGVSEIPSLFVIDPEGTVVFKEVGYHEDLYEQLTSLFSSRMQ